MTRTTRAGPGGGRMGPMVYPEYDQFLNYWGIK